MNEYERTGNVTKSAQLADVSRPTARKYLNAQKAPGELQAKHTWRTRPDPLVAIWPEAEARLKEAPELEAKAHVAAKPARATILGGKGFVLAADYFADTADCF